MRIFLKSNRPFFVALVFVLFIVCAAGVFAQQPDRYALVIGNSSYAGLGELKNARNDATDMAAALKDLGFEVTSLIDADLIQMEEAVSRFSKQLAGSPNTMGLFYYAGHGVQSNGINYLIPTDARIPEESYLKVRAVPVQAILEDLQSAKNRLNIIILDACRDNPFSWARSGTRGLTVVSSQPPRSIIVYATSAGSTALEGTGRNGVFTGELLKHLRTPGIDVMEIFNRAGAAVQQVTNGKQNPAIYSQFFDKAYFAQSVPMASVQPSQPVSKTPSMVIQKNYGSIEVSVRNAGMLMLDGKPMGVVSPGSTAVLNDVEEGHHELRMQYGTGNVEIQTVDVGKDQKAMVSFEKAFFSVRYEANGATSGTAPVDNHSYAPGEEVTVLGNIANLAKTGYSFAGWNTKPDGSGIDYAAGSSVIMNSANLILYAKWPACQIAQVAAGTAHTMFLKTDGTLWAAGRNDYGQLGDGTIISRRAPLQVMIGVHAVAAGGAHTMILKTDGTLWATGWNYYGQLGDGTYNNRSMPVQVMTGVQAVASGGNHTMILKTDGTLWATGWNAFGQLGFETNGVSYTPIPVQIKPIQIMTSVQAVASGSAHTLILKRDGTLWATGANADGQLGDGITTSRQRPIQVLRDVLAVAAGGSHTMILKTDGSLWATGSNNHGQLGDGTTTNRSTPKKIMTGVQAVAAGYMHTMILKADSTLWAAGSNEYGQLGDGTTIDRYIPVQVMTGVQAVFAGVSHTLILKTDGTLWATGFNGSGQLGDGTTTERHTPVQITF